MDWCFAVAELEDVDVIVDEDVSGVDEDVGGPAWCSS
jgi:hypothetical protein